MGKKRWQRVRPADLAKAEVQAKVLKAFDQVARTQAEDNAEGRPPDTALAGRSGGGLDSGMESGEI